MNKLVCGGPRQSLAGEDEESEALFSQQQMGIGAHISSHREHSNRLDEKAKSPKRNCARLQFAQKCHISSESSARPQSSLVDHVKDQSNNTYHRGGLHPALQHQYEPDKVVFEASTTFVEADAPRQAENQGPVPKNPSSKGRRGRTRSEPEVRVRRPKSILLESPNQENLSSSHHTSMEYMTPVVEKKTSSPQRFKYVMPETLRRRSPSSSEELSSFKRSSSLCPITKVKHAEMTTDLGSMTDTIPEGAEFVVQRFAQADNTEECDTLGSSRVNRDVSQGAQDSPTARGLNRAPSVVRRSSPTKNIRLHSPLKDDKTFEGFPRSRSARGEHVSSGVSRVSKTTLVNPTSALHIDGSFARALRGTGMKREEPRRTHLTTGVVDDSSEGSSWRSIQTGRTDSVVYGGQTIGSSHATEASNPYNFGWWNCAVSDMLNTGVCRDDVAMFVPDPYHGTTKAEI